MSTLFPSISYSRTVITSEEGGGPGDGKTVSGRQRACALILIHYRAEFRSFNSASIEHFFFLWVKENNNSKQREDNTEGMKVISESF